MPQVIVIGTKLEAMAASTIAQRGIQLVATASGVTIENLIMNPSLEMLVGGVQGRFSSSASFDTLQGAANNVDKVADGRRSLVLVVFIGGVTFAEISALRFLSSQEGMAYDLIVGTTKIISGRSLTETFVGKMDNL